LNQEAVAMATAVAVVALQDAVNFKGRGVVPTFLFLTK
jgi:hypothetical protein